MDEESTISLLNPEDDREEEEEDETTLSVAAPGELTQLWMACVGEEVQGATSCLSPPPASPIPTPPSFTSVEALLSSPPQPLESTGAFHCEEVGGPSFNLNPADWSDFPSPPQEDRVLESNAMDTLVQRGAGLPLRTSTPCKQKKTPLR